MCAIVHVDKDLAKKNSKKCQLDFLFANFHFFNEKVHSGLFLLPISFTYLCFLDFKCTFFNRSFSSGGGSALSLESLWLSVLFSSSSSDSCFKGFTEIMISFRNPPVVFMFQKFIQKGNKKNGALLTLIEVLLFEIQ